MADLMLELVPLTCASSTQISYGALSPAAVCLHPTTHHCNLCGDHLGATGSLILCHAMLTTQGVTHAQIVFPEYFDPIQKYGPPECISAIQSAVQSIDTLLSLPAPIPQAVKSLFGLGELKDDADFAEVLTIPIGTCPCFQWEKRSGA
jgi:hypothetical protein